MYYDGYVQDRSDYQNDIGILREIELFIERHQLFSMSVELNQQMLGQ